MKLLTAALTLLTTLPTLAADPALIDFEKQWGFADGDVDGYYAGGTAADGTSGPNLGVSFVNVSGLSNDASFTYYSGAPSMLGTAYAHTFAATDRAFMNVAAGVANTISFWYSSPSAVLGAVRAYSGLDGGGTLLGSVDLSPNGSSYATWTPVTFAFTGIARSFDLTAGANVVGFDDISVTVIPEPSTTVLMLIGGAAIAGAVRRRRI